MHLTKLDLPEDETVDYAGETAVVSGYGYTWMKLLFGLIEDKGGSEHRLKYASVNIIDTETCAKTNYLRRIDGTKQICGQLFQRNSETPEGICAVSIIISDLPMNVRLYTINEFCRVVYRATVVVH